MKNNKIKHDFECDICGSPATINLQSNGLVLWKLTEEGDFKKIEDCGVLGEDRNEFYCDECAKNEGLI